MNPGACILDAFGPWMRYSAAEVFGSHFALIGKDIQAWVNLFAEDSA